MAVRSFEVPRNQSKRPFIDTSTNPAAVSTGIISATGKAPAIQPVQSSMFTLDGPARQEAMTEPAEAAHAKIERIVITPALIIYRPAQRLYYLAGGGDLWYSAPQAAGPYTGVTALRLPPTPPRPRKTPASPGSRR
jgi:hypothetical protein